MQPGKVFLKLQNDKRVSSIDFSGVQAVVTLREGFNVEGKNTLTCATAHEARLWIARAVKGAATVAAPAPRPAAPRPASAPVRPATDANGNRVLLPSVLRDMLAAGTVREDDVVELTSKRALVRA